MWKKKKKMTLNTPLIDYLNMIPCFGKSGTTLINFLSPSMELRGLVQSVSAMFSFPWVFYIIIIQHLNVKWINKKNIIIYIYLQTFVFMVRGGLMALNVGCKFHRDWISSEGQSDHVILKLGKSALSYRSRWPPPD